METIYGFPKIARGLSDVSPVARSVIYFPSMRRFVSSLPALMYVVHLFQLISLRESSDVCSYNMVDWHFAWHEVTDRRKLKIDKL